MPGSTRAHEPASCRGAVIVAGGARRAPSQHADPALLGPCVGSSASELQILV